MENTFGFVIHPIDHKRHVARRYPFLARALTRPQIDFFSTFFPPVHLSVIEGACSAATRKEVRGWLVACPLTPRQMLALPEAFVYHKIIQAGRLAERLGARILGLGAFTSVVGDAGITVASKLDIPVTTGDSLTVATVVQTIRQATHLMGTDIEHATAAIVGATGAIGSACAQLLAEDVGELILIGRREQTLEAIRERCEGHKAQIRIATELSAMRQADLILMVTSSVEPLVKAEHLKPGAVVCDASRPRDVSREVAAQRSDVLVIEGGMVDVPGNVDFHFDIDLPQEKTYACMAETMALAMEGRYESFTLGKEISVERAREIEAIAARHGFRLAGFLSFGRSITEEDIVRVRDYAEIARCAPRSGMANRDVARMHPD